MKLHSSHKVYKGKVVNLRVDEIDTLDGRSTRIVEVVEHVGGVGIIAMPTPETIVLVRQRRHAVDADLWEIPAGMIEKDEPPLETAKRELIEETGYRAERMRFLWSIYTTPGFCSERIYFFIAEGLTAGEAAPEEDESFELCVWDVEEVWRSVERDELRDAKTQIALAWARSQRELSRPAEKRPYVE